MNASLKLPTFSSRFVTRAAFVVIIVFVLAQVTWWLIFQRIYLDAVTAETLAAWQQDAVAATLAFERDATLEAQLLTLYPHLMLDEEALAFTVDPQARLAFQNKQGRLVRMFAFEGPFFVLVILTGLAIIARSLRLERMLKKRQQNFLSAVTHEFKTPLSTLRLLLETVLMRSLTVEKQRDYLRRMDNELTRLEQTSEQVLAAARLEQSADAPVLAALDLNSVVRDVIGRAREGLEARGAQLSVSYSPEPLPVSLDARAFHMVLNNLLDNAVKYTRRSPKPVWVRLEAQGDLILLHVEDQGVGIADAERTQVFEQFYRVGSELTRSAKGVGLGLHLVKSITEAMNGWVKVDANTPLGTRFTVILPRRVVLTSEPAISEPAISEPPTPLAERSA